jgi:hypothetical protein
MAWRPTSRRFDTNPGSAGSAAAAPRYRWSASPSEAPPRTRSSAVACWHAAPRHGQPRARAAQRPGRAPTRRSSHSAPKSDPVVVPAGRSGVGKMLVAGAVEIDGGTPRRARLKVIDGFGKQELHAFVLGAANPAGHRRRAVLPEPSRCPARRDHPRPDGGTHRAALRTLVHKPFTLNQVWTKDFELK